MAPNGKKALSAAERQRKRREKLKKEGRYIEYKARHANYQKKYCERKDSQLKSRTTEEQAEAVLLRKEDRLRKRGSRAKVKTPGVSKQNHTAYSRLSSLNRAVNTAKKFLPKSPRKRSLVAKRLASEFQDCENSRDTRIQVRHLLFLPNETVTNVKGFYLRDDISRTAPGKKDSATVRDKNGEKSYRKGICT